MNQRLRLALIVVVFFAVPALLTLSLINSDQAQEAQRGLQPGGPIRGRVLGPDGKGLAGIDLRLLLDPTSGETPDSIAAHASSASDGSFELIAPPLDGRYTVVAGGGTWQHAVSSFSFVGRDANQDLTLHVAPGCELEVRFTHEDGSAPGGGSFDLEGEARGNWFSIFGGPTLHVQGRLEDGGLRVEALPPIKARLNVRFDTGEHVELELQLEAGRTQRSVRL